MANPKTPERRRLDAFLDHDVGADLARIGMAKVSADTLAGGGVETAVRRWHVELTEVLVRMARELKALGATDDQIRAWKGRTVESYFANVADAGHDAFAAMPVQGQA